MTAVPTGYTPTEVYLMRLVGRLHAGQRHVLERFHASTARRFVLCCSRRDGKSTLCCTLALGVCLQQARAQVRYAAPTSKMGRTIVEPLMRELLTDCPPEALPVYGKLDGVWRFPSTGAELHLVGCDNGGHERLRGAGLDLGILDEAGFIDELDYVVKSILQPQTLTTGGRLLLASTPSKTPAHDFTAYCTEAEARGSYVHRTIYDSPHISDAQRAEFMAEAGGAESSNWRREYLARFVVDESSAVVPEFARHEDAVVTELERPLYFDSYVAMDVGYHDLTVALLGYYDFTRARVVVEDEVVLARATSDVIDAAVAAREEALWPGLVPYMRVVDAPPLVIAELNRDGRPWVPTRKDAKDAQVNALRRAVAEHKLAIHPRCTTLRAHLRHAVWNTARTSYARSAGSGHFDAVDAAVYLVRAVDQSRNPYPALSSGVTYENHHIPAGLARAVSSEGRVVEQMFGRRRRR
jgi:hypothetical protein